MGAGALNQKEFLDIFSEGEILYCQGKFAEAKEKFSRLARDYDEEMAVQNYLGLIKLELGEYQDAIVNFARAGELLSFAELEKKDSAKRQLVFSLNRAVCFQLLEDNYNALDLLMRALVKYLEDDA